MIRPKFWSIISKVSFEFARLNPQIREATARTKAKDVSLATTRLHDWIGLQITNMFNFFAGTSKIN
jgi:hypothetical protein